MASEKKYEQTDLDFREKPKLIKLLEEGKIEELKDDQDLLKATQTVIKNEYYKDFKDGKNISFSAGFAGMVFLELNNLKKSHGDPAFDISDNDTFYILLKATLHILENNKEVFDEDIQKDETFLNFIKENLEYKDTDSNLKNYTENLYKKTEIYNRKKSEKYKKTRPDLYE